MQNESFIYKILSREFQWNWKFFSCSWYDCYQQYVFEYYKVRMLLANLLLLWVLLKLLHVIEYQEILLQGYEKQILLGLKEQQHRFTKQNVKHEWIFFSSYSSKKCKQILPYSYVYETMYTAFILFGCLWNIKKVNVKIVFIRNKSNA